MKSIIFHNPPPRLPKSLKLRAQNLPSIFKFLVTKITHTKKIIADILTQKHNSYLAPSKESQLRIFLMQNVNLNSALPSPANIRFLRIQFST